MSAMTRLVSMIGDISDKVSLLDANIEISHHKAMLAFERRYLFVPLIVVLNLSAILPASGSDPTMELNKQFRRPSAIPFPKYNPYSRAKESLGKTLFFDPRLSGSNDIACVICHNPELGWEDGRKTALGAEGREGNRHTQTLLNQAWGLQFGWDGRAPTLEAFTLRPIVGKSEMNLSNVSTFGTY